MSNADTPPSALTHEPAPLRPVAFLPELDLTGGYIIQLVNRCFQSP